MSVPFTYISSRLFLTQAREAALTAVLLLVEAQSRRSDNGY